MDNILKQAFSIFTELIGNGMCILPPDKDFLFYEEYDFSYINIHHRDEGTNLVGKREKNEFGNEITKDNPIKFSYECAKDQTHYIDFGDSANKIGHLAFCNSLIDQNNLHFFENGNGVMVRHPTQIPWNNPNNCTRDQLIAYAAGCWRAGQNEIVQRLLREHEKRTNILGLPLCQNTDDNCPNTTKKVTLAGVELFVETDILAPHHIMFLRICSGDKEAYKDPIGQLFLQLDIEATTKDVTQEKNQLIVMAIVCGRLDLYVQVHDNYKENILFYWDNHVNGFDQKDQRQIGEAYIKVIEQELKRYSGQLTPSILGLPYETIQTLLTSILTGIPELDSILSGEYTAKLLKALTSDIQKIAKQIESYVTNAFKNPLNILNIPFMPFNPVAKLLNNLFNGTDLSEVYFRLNEIQKGIIELKKLSEQILQEVADIPDEVKKKLYLGEINPTIETFKEYSNAYGTLANTKGVDVAIEAYSNDLNSLIKDFSINIHKYFEFETKYFALPFVVNVMDMHISCITMAKGKFAPALIIEVIEKYKKWIKNVVDDRTPDSLFRKIESLQNEIKSNVSYIKLLYGISFKITSESFLEDIGKPPPHDPAEVAEYSIGGIAKKYDYILHEVIDIEKNQNLKEIIDRGILDSSCLPKIVEKKLLGEEAFFLEGNSGNKNKPPVKIPNFTTIINSEQTEIELTYSPLQIWSLSNKSLTETEVYPLVDKNKYIDACEKLKSFGEIVINLCILMYIGQTALERIEEITKTANDLLDK